MTCPISEPEVVDGGLWRLESNGDPRERKASHKETSWFVNCHYSEQKAAKTRLVQFAGGSLKTGIFGLSNGRQRYFRE